MGTTPPPQYSPPTMDDKARLHEAPAPPDSRKRARSLGRSSGPARKRPRSPIHALSLAQLAAVVCECAPTPPVTALQKLARRVRGESHVIRTSAPLASTLLDALAATVKRARPLATVRAAGRVLVALAPVLDEATPVAAPLTSLVARTEQLRVVNAASARDKALATLLAALAALLEAAPDARTAILLKQDPTVVARLSPLLRTGPPPAVTALLAVLWTVTRFAEPPLLHVGGTVQGLVDVVWASLESPAIDEPSLQVAVGTLANLTSDAPSLRAEVQAAGGASALAHALERLETRIGRIKVLKAVRNLALNRRARAELHDHDVPAAVRALLPADVTRAPPSPYAEDAVAVLWNLALDDSAVARLRADVPDLTACLRALADSPRHPDLVRRYAGGALAALEESETRAQSRPAHA